MSNNLKSRIHQTLKKVMEMQGGARIGVGGAMAGGRRRKRGGVGVGGRKRKMHAGVLMDDYMHPDMYARHAGAGKKRGRGVAGGASRRYRGGANPWIAHVKKFARAHGLSYGEAMKKARSSYRG